ncbi:MAG: CapA family protein [Oscillatoria sp. SIO1A7]|nr:CapA family protein [Oscillatoria sp. SIO1A7]
MPNAQCPIPKISVHLWEEKIVDKLNRDDRSKQRKQKNVKAIAELLRTVLQTQDIAVKVGSKDSAIYVVLESASIPPRKKWVSYLKYTLPRLRLESSLQTVKVYGRQLGRKRAAWVEAFELARPKASDIQRSKVKQTVNFLFCLVGCSSFLIGASWNWIGDREWHSNAAIFSSNPETMSLEPETTKTKANNETPSASETNEAKNQSNNQAKGRFNLLFESLSPDSKIEPILLQPFPSANLVAIFENISDTIEASLPPASIAIKAVGDIVPGTNFPSNKLPAKPDLLFESVEPYLQGADLLFGNLECPLTLHPYSAKDISRPLVFAFRAPPSYAQVFKKIGFDVMNIANNHSSDFGSVGLKDTIAHLEKAGLKTIGQKNEIIYLTVKNVPVAWIGFSTYHYHNSVHDLENAQRLIAEAKQKAEIVVVSMQAGAEGVAAKHVRNRTEMFYGENRGNVVRFARFAIDAGADLILGHGPHITRALELYKGKLIAYSLGNFIGYRSLSTAGQLSYSLILEVELDLEGNFVSGQIIPVRLDRKGIPRIDTQYGSVDFIGNLTKSDFPQTPLIIDSQGEIAIKPQG